MLLLPGSYFFVLYVFEMLEYFILPGRACVILTGRLVYYIYILKFPLFQYLRKLLCFLHMNNSFE